MRYSSLKDTSVFKKSLLGWNIGNKLLSLTKLYTYKVYGFEVVMVLLFRES